MTGTDVTRALPGVKPRLYEDATGSHIKPRLVDIYGLCQYLSVGKNSAYRIGAAAGALFKAGKKNLYDLQAIDRFIDQNRENERIRE